MKIISLFSGCGGLDLGFKKAGFEVPGGMNLTQQFMKLLKVNHPNTHLEGDIRKVTRRISPNIFLEMLMELLVPPCQSWSEAGALRELRMIGDNCF